MELKGKKVLVFGAGKSGIGAADLLECSRCHARFSTMETQIWIKKAVLHKTMEHELPRSMQEIFRKK